MTCTAQFADIFVSPVGNCTLQANEEKTCETCVRKGHDCFWCGGNVNRCMNYEWYFPQCPLDDVRHKNCWVNLSAVVIVVTILGGIILVILLACLCYCCCRCKQYRREQAKKKGEKWQQRYNQSMRELESRQSERSEKRNKELEAFRLKYGIKPPDYETATKK
ncbi:unnamed protein product [Auanema sp. JU1783]|nr:unnamed protein product [Auanema sp. JU1783]